MTPEQWTQVEKELSSLWGHVQLLADGYTLDLVVERTSALRFKISAYIDGVIDGKMVLDDDAEAARKFWHPRKLHLYKPAARRKMAEDAKRRDLSERLRTWNERNASAYKIYHMPYWPSAKPLIRHLRKTCLNIELIKGGGDK